MRDVQFGADYPSILPIAETHARLLDATPDEVKAAAQTVVEALRHPLLERARQAAQRHRELPILIKDDLVGLLEAVIDLAFLEDDAWIVVDFKTDVEDANGCRNTGGKSVGMFMAWRRRPANGPEVIYCTFSRPGRIRIRIIHGLNGFNGWAHQTAVNAPIR